MRLILLVALVGVLFFGAFFVHDYQANRDFTPWMTGHELDQFCAEREVKAPDGSGNFWDQGHWVEAVEGRWHDGVPQYRVRYGKSPKGTGVHFWWYWWFNQSQAAYTQHVHELADQGFTLLDPNSFQRPDDTRRYQGVWHKTETQAEYEAEHPAAVTAPLAPTVLKPTAAAPPPPPAQPAFPVVEHGHRISISNLHRSAIGEACSVYLKPGVIWGLPLTSDLAPGMYVTRGKVQIISGTISALTVDGLSLRNASTVLPIPRHQIDYVVLAP